MNSKRIQGKEEKTRGSVEKKKTISVGKKKKWG
jgi:hypothetical protein